jgi:hypothetical protein
MLFLALFVWMYVLFDGGCVVMDISGPRANKAIMCRRVGTRGVIFKHRCVVTKSQVQFTCNGPRATTF